MFERKIEKVFDRTIPKSIFIYKDRGQYVAVQRSDKRALDALRINLIDDTTLLRRATSLHRENAGLYQLVVIDGQVGIDATIASRALFNMAICISSDMEEISSSAARAHFKALHHELNEILCAAKRVGKVVEVPGAEPKKAVA